MSNHAKAMTSVIGIGVLSTTINAISGGLVQGIIAATLTIGLPLGYSRWSRHHRTATRIQPIVKLPVIVALDEAA